MSANKVLCIGRVGVADPICTHLRSAGWEVHRAADLRAAKRLLTDRHFTVGVLVYAGVDDAVCAQLNAFLAVHGNLEWLGCFDAPSLKCSTCRDLILVHLFDHHTLPVDLDRMTVCLGHAHGRATLRETAAVADTRGDPAILGQSAAIVELLRQVRRTASADAPVLIHGESGSGKELIAEAVHRQSPRAKGPFVPINCGAIQAGLIQSELFGHARGAFTGAVEEKRGLFEVAEGGTVFLDEIGDLPLDLQVNLLRFLQEGTICRVGATQVKHLDVRVVAATNVDLQKAVVEGRFREDLFYRLNVLPLHVAPLRERREDVKVLAHHFFRKFSAEKSARLKGFSRLALMTMEAHSWPGNVRELINRVRCSMIMAEGKLIMPADLGLEAPTSPELQNVLDAARRKAERGAIYSSLQQTGRNVATSARQLGVSRMTLYRLMVKHGLNAPP
ncbi:MAG TPA: sigma-54 dependent transcriptional regulator [Caldimonas sp.]|nr:sigma-54 dependent transcriptional regulator [Caldimonas sp.]